MKLRTIRNTYTQEEQERNDALKAQYDRMMTHASRHLSPAVGVPTASSGTVSPTPSTRHPHPAVCLPTASSGTVSPTPSTRRRYHTPTGQGRRRGGALMPKSTHQRRGEIALYAGEDEIGMMAAYHNDCGEVE